MFQSIINFFCRLLNLEESHPEFISLSIPTPTAVRPWGDPEFAIVYADYIFHR